MQGEPGRLHLEPDLVDRVGDLAEHLVQHVDLLELGRVERQLRRRGRRGGSRCRAIRPAACCRAGRRPDRGCRSERPLTRATRVSRQREQAQHRVPRLGQRACLLGRVDLGRQRAVEVEGDEQARRARQLAQRPGEGGWQSHAYLRRRIGRSDVHSRSPSGSSSDAPELAARSDARNVSDQWRHVVLAHPLAQRPHPLAPLGARHRDGAQDGVLQPVDVVRVDEQRRPSVRRPTPVNSLSTSTPSSSNRAATYSLATRFMPSRSAVTSITSEAR